MDSQDLYYYRARYYDPSIGRFISKDPIEFLAGDTNFYRYVGGDPVNFVDPSGLAGNKAYGTEGYIPGPIPRSELKCDNAVLNIAVAGSANSALNFVNSFVNTGLNAMNALGEAMEPYDGAIISVSQAMPQTKPLVVIPKIGKALRFTGTLGKVFAKPIKCVKDVGNVKKQTGVQIYKNNSWKGPADYSKLKDHKSVGKSKKFTTKQRKDILDVNRKHNDGILRSDKDGTMLNQPKQSQRGVKADMHQAEVDHIDSRAKGGSNSHRNAQVLSKEQNIEKSDN